MPIIDSAPSRAYDPLQSVLAHLPDGMYGSYEGLCNFMLIDPLVPMNVKEGLRYLSAVTIGCEFCRTFKEVDSDGNQLLPNSFYEQVAAGAPDWEACIEAKWAPTFEMATEVLGDGEITPRTLERLKANLTDSQIVESLFYLLLIGASHRFSHALGVDATCPVPTRLLAGAEAAAPLAQSSTGR
jgi:hypothetical protein